MLHEVHPSDAIRLLRLGEALRDYSTIRAYAHASVAALMPMVRPDCSADGSDAIAERLLNTADARLGSVVLAHFALVEMLLKKEAHDVA